MDIKNYQNKYQKVYVGIAHELKEEYDKVLEQLGISSSAAINIFVHLLVQEKRLPFNLDDSRVNQLVEEYKAKTTGTGRRGRPPGTSNIQDYTGQKFGTWTVLEKIEGRKTPSGSRIWKCQCECGIVSDRTIYHIKKGSCSNCGNYRSNMIGQKIGKLTVVKKLSITEKLKAAEELSYVRAAPKMTWWLCKCECGTEMIFSKQKLFRKIKSCKSCGCLKNGFPRHQ